jgi:hypothetical protein
MLFDRPRPLRDEEVEEVEVVVEGYSEMRAMTEGSKNGRLLTDWERFSLVVFFDDDDGSAHWLRLESSFFTSWEILLNAEFHCSCVMKTGTDLRTLVVRASEETGLSAATEVGVAVAATGELDTVTARTTFCATRRLVCFGHQR